MSRKREIKVKLYARAIIAITLITSWSLLSLSGLVLWLAPTGRRSGQIELLFGLTKQEWGDVHFWIAIATIIITLAHIIIDWKVFRGIIRYLTNPHRRRDMLSS
ncbi:MAG: DUF4405 domain-containing protein [Chloroflexi bacterium]|nr:DUF4405 domain-containing protein [Chloroflexota bacterium]MBM3172481.1 DUF4405 domain-containing protein [Chloroflexota bacterium]MBM3175114.1 DUF4405 domain-containing protein [Chloroflexota bacterium]MBM4450754.1 DUF4405 domain-containing protein [Chloroflexota bacterium]